MRNNLFKVIGGMLLLVSFGLIAYVGLGIIQGGSFHGTSIITTGVVIGIPMILGTVFLLVGVSTTAKKKQIVSYIEYVVFATYILVLLAILFLGGREYMNYESMGQIFEDNVNLIPFRTIIDYIKSFINNTINKDTIILNLLGNLMLFMPMGVLLPCMFKIFRTWRVFIVYMVLILCGVEIIQLLTATGSLDIDDFILNMSGACLIFAIMRKDKVITLCQIMYLM